MMATVAEIAGLPGLPASSFGVRQWLNRLNIPHVLQGKRFAFALSHLSCPGAAHSGDGKVLRYTFLALVDCAANFVLDRELAESGNARSTVRLIKRTCQTCGIFDRLCPDNGSAFAGHLVAGGAVHKFRNSLKAAIHDLKLRSRGGR